MIEITSRAKWYHSKQSVSQVYAKNPAAASAGHPHEIGWPEFAVGGLE